MESRTASCAAQGVQRLVLTATLLLPLSQAAVAYDPAVGDYGKQNPLDIRLLTYNTHGEFIATPSKDAAFGRILTTLSPDVIVFQEIPVDVSANQIAGRLNQVLPVAGGSWYKHDGLDDGYTRVVVASRYPLSMTRTDTLPASSIRGVNIALVDLPDAWYLNDIYVLGVHFKAMSGTYEDRMRQRAADAVASWLGDARQPGGNVTLPPGTPMVVLGDFNLVGPSMQPETTLITGDIADNATFGPDIKGDWDGSNLTDLVPADPFTGGTGTWSSNYSHPDSRLDRFIYTDSAVLVSLSFALNTLNMSPQALAGAGLQADDTTSSASSDHLPIVMDLNLHLPPPCNDPFADADGDADVDQSDFAAWQICGGSDWQAAGYPCACFDRDGDGSVTEFDLDPFSVCISRPGVPADPACDD